MKEYFVISHTHWDREWYLPLESMKLKLCDLMDHCLRLLDCEPDYIFHLDAQTVVLEDYLEVRPSKKSTLEKHIQSGRLIVGPWYLQNDFYLTSGESTVRNLLEGRHVATAFGKCDTVGYAADQFGLISQLPQILRGFGIDNLVFGRGYDRKRRDGSKSPTEFIWRAPDGSSVLSIFMRCWYNNAQRISSDVEKARLLLEYNDMEFSGAAHTPYVLLMNGVDHLEPQDNILQNLQELNKHLPEGHHIHQAALSEYVDCVKDYCKKVSLPDYVHTGELRQGPDSSILKGTLSSRFYLKAANVKAQTMLEHVLEPLYSMLELSGMEGTYSIDHFRYMWKQLLKNHPHDSICGCSRDEVHKHMEDNYERLATTSEDMLARGMKLAAGHLRLGGRTSDNYIIATANTTQSIMNSVVELNVDIPQTECATNIEICDNEGNPVEFVILEKEKAVRDGLSPLNLPGTIPVDRFKISLRTGDINPFSFKGFVVNKSSAPITLANQASKPMGTPAVAENEFLKLIVHNEGTVELFDKETGYHCSDLLNIEDTADQGDSYVYIPMENDKPILASDFPATVIVQRSDKLATEITIKRTMQIPEEFDFSQNCRAEKLVSIPVSLVIRLSAGSKQLEVRSCIDNKARDHRMRLLVNTGICTASSIADIPFDIVSHTTDDHYEGTWSKVLPNSSFAALEDQKNGLAVFTEGAHEYEHMEENGTLAFTVLRATGVIGRDYETLEKIGGDIWFCPENQCLRTMDGRFGIMPYSGNVIDAEIPSCSVQFRTGVPVAYTSSDERRFMQGRPAVQDTRLQEYFFSKDLYEGVSVHDNRSLLTVNGRGVVVTALKKSESGCGTIVRTVNLSSSEVRVAIGTKRKIKVVHLDESENQKQDGTTLGPKKITTYLLSE